MSSIIYFFSIFSQWTLTRFWPDSRDHFDEYGIERILTANKIREGFPVNAWWVRQGFDSGILLINRELCGREIRTVSLMARSKKYNIIRDLSMVRFHLKITFFHTSHYKKQSFSLLHFH